MSKLKLTLPGGEIPVNGKQVSFRAPCDCASVTCLTIDGEDYTLVDSCNCELTGSYSLWAQGALVTALLDVDNKRAYLINTKTSASEVLVWQNPLQVYEDFPAGDFTVPGVLDTDTYPYVIIETLNGNTFRFTNWRTVNGYLTNNFIDTDNNNALVMWSRRVILGDNGLLRFGDNYVTTISSSGTVTTTINNGVNKPTAMYLGGSVTDAAGIMEAIENGSY